MKNENAVSELAFLFKLLPVMQEVESVDRIYRLLLAITTAVTSIVYERAMVFVVDEHEGVVSGRYGVSYPESGDSEDSTFEEMARRVFATYEAVESGDLTLRARSFSVPLGWHRSAIVTAVKSGYPVIAERAVSEYATDPFFDFFETEGYVAVPMKLNDRVAAVLVADRARASENSADDVSLVYSLSQQAAAAAQHLLEISSHKRRSRILFKVNQILGGTKDRSKFDEGLKLVLIMLTRAIGASGCFLKDLTGEKTVHIKSVHEYAPDADEEDIAIGETFEGLLDRAAGRMEAFGGGEGDALLGEAAKSIRSFYVCPLVAGGDVAGAIAVYTDTENASPRSWDHERSGKSFVQLVAGIVASHIQAKETEQRIRRAEEFLQEMGSNLSRERDRSRQVDNTADFHSRVSGDLGLIQEHLSSKAPHARRLEKIAELVESLRGYSDSFKRGVLARATKYSTVDIFEITRCIVDDWRPEVVKKGIEVLVRVPAMGPSLLMDKKKISLAIKGILETTATCLEEGNRMLIECSATDDGVVLCFADNGLGLPGDIISRLFMPFESAETSDEKKRALSLAGEIIQKHSGEIMIKSSCSWKTILILTFPRPANRDRRKVRRDRRRARDRRARVKAR
ncbi:MAG: ATP-binding protein [Candidatus Krumholzibacteriia bacterium]